MFLLTYKLDTILSETCILYWPIFLLQFTKYTGSYIYIYIKRSKIKIYYTYALEWDVEIIQFLLFFILTLRRIVFISFSNY